MAAITFNTTCRKMRPRAQLETMLFACRDMLDAFVSHRMRHAAAEAEQVRTRRPEGKPSNVPTDPSETPAVRLRPLDPNILSEAVPAFFIGRNGAGLWVARETNGRIGGIFLLKSSAQSFAHAQGGRAMIFPSQRFELDLENNGNPFATRLVALIRFAAALWCRVSRSGEGHQGRREESPRSSS
jgi:hypothetical protein